MAHPACNAAWRHRREQRAQITKDPYNKMEQLHNFDTILTDDQASFTLDLIKRFMACSDGYAGLSSLYRGELFPMYGTLLFDIRDHVGYITLNRPDAANTFNLDLARDLMHAALECNDNPEVRAVVITGSGNSFSAGGDLKSFAAKGEALPAHLKEVTTYLHAAVSYLTRMDAPVVAAVNGVAAGAGMSLACACDMVIAAESARFTMAYTRAGLTPDGSATYFLSRIVGLKRALELTLTNRLLSSTEAYEWGIAARVVPDDQLMTEASSLAVQLAAGPTKAYGASKRLLHRGWGETLETQMAYETESIARMSNTHDGREGIAAFLEKRKPEFKGE